MGFILTYFILYKILFPILFEKPLLPLGKGTILSFLIIIVLSLINYFFIISFLNIESGIGNRLLHAFGGAFIAFLVCFLVVKDGKLDISKFQFFIISLLMVTALGVVNEIYEFILQNYFDKIAAATVDDTWLDLISNTVGILVAGICFIPFINRKK